MTRAQLASLRTMASTGTCSQLHSTAALDLLDEVDRLRAEMARLDAIVFHHQSRGWPAYTEEERRRLAVQPDFDAQSRAVRRHMQTWLHAGTADEAPSPSADGGCGEEGDGAVPAQVAQGKLLP